MGWIPATCPRWPQRQRRLVEASCAKYELDPLILSLSKHRVVTVTLPGCGAKVMETREMASGSGVIATRSAPITKRRHLASVCHIKSLNWLLVPIMLASCSAESPQKPELSESEKKFETQISGLSLIKHDMSEEEKMKTDTAWGEGYSRDHKWTRNAFGGGAPGNVRVGTWRVCGERTVCIKPREPEKPEFRHEIWFGSSGLVFIRARFKSSSMS